MDYNQELSHKKKKKHRTWVTGLVVLIIIAACGGSVYLFFFTDTFYYNHIEINGLRQLKPVDILKSERISFFESLPVINPQIKSRTVERHYFERKLVIFVVEREPYAIWCRGQDGAPVFPAPSITVTPIAMAISTEASSSGSAANKPLEVILGEAPQDCYWFDRDGFIMADAPATEGVLIKDVSDVSGREVNIGDYVLPDEELAAMFRIFSFIDKSGLEIKSYRLEPLNKQELLAFIKAGPVIYFSLRLDPSFALEPIKSLASTLPSLQYVDLRSENKIFYK